MNKLDAILRADKLDKDCSFKLHGLGPPQARPLKDFGINEEGYCIFCEGYSSYRTLLKTGISAFLRFNRFQKKEIGIDAILFENEIDIH